MNVEAQTHPANNDWPSPHASERGWSWKKTWVFIGIAFAVHLALLFIFAARKPPAPRVPGNVPQFDMAASDPVLIALDDPTLFAVPHVQDFVPAVWRRQPNIVLPPTTLIEPSPYLLPQTESLGKRFAEFMATNRFTSNPLDFKPEPRFSTPIVAAISLLPTNSTLSVTDDLAKRLHPGSVNLPIFPYNDVLAPSRVQVLVDTSGRVFSEVLLDSSGYGKADQQALDIARSLHFTPAGKPSFGNLIFHWHTIPEPVANTNSPTVAP